MKIKSVSRRGRGGRKSRGPRDIYLVADKVNIITRGGASPSVGYGGMGGVSGGGKRQYHFGFDPAEPPASVTGPPSMVEPPAPMEPSPRDVITNSLGRIGSMLGRAALGYAGQAFLNQASSWGGSDMFNNSTTPNRVDASTSTTTPRSVDVGVGNDAVFDLGPTPGSVVRVDQGVQATSIAQQPDVLRSTSATQTGGLGSVTTGTSMGGGGGAMTMGTQTGGISASDFGMQTDDLGLSMVNPEIRKPLALPMPMTSAGMQTSGPSMMESGFQTSGPSMMESGFQTSGPSMMESGFQTAPMRGRKPVGRRTFGTQMQGLTMSDMATQAGVSTGIDAGVQAVDPTLARSVGTEAAVVTQSGTVGLERPSTASMATQADDPEIEAMKRELENYHNRLLDTGADASTVLALNGALTEMLQESQATNSNTQRVLANTLGYLETFLDQVIGDPRWRDLLDRNQSADQQIQQIFGLVSSRDPNLRQFIKKVGLFAEKLVNVQDQTTMTETARQMRDMGTDPAFFLNLKNVTSTGTDPAVFLNLKNTRTTGTDPAVFLNVKSTKSTGTDPAVFVNVKKTKTTGTDPAVFLKKNNTRTVGTDPAVFLNVKNTRTVGTDPALTLRIPKPRPAIPERPASTMTAESTPIQKTPSPTSPIAKRTRSKKRKN